MQIEEKALKSLILPELDYKGCVQAEPKSVFPSPTNRCTPHCCCWCCCHCFHDLPEGLCFWVDDNIWHGVLFSRLKPVVFGIEV